MIIDGRTIAISILASLAPQVVELKAKGVTPTLAVILVGDNPSSVSFIRQKQKAINAIGAAMIYRHLPTTTKEELEQIIDAYNADPDVHGIIIQRPVPGEIGDSTIILDSVNPAKDVDGFVPASPFEVPVAQAVLLMLEEVYKQQSPPLDFKDWLTAQRITIIGRGVTAGKPIDRAFAKLQCATSVIHSETPNPDELLKTSDIIISCVGKQGVLRADTIKPGAILIGVGISGDEHNAMRGDYSEEAVREIAAWYTPTPGGVGPVNVACLMKNLVKACMMNKGGTL